MSRYEEAMGYAIPRATPAEMEKLKKKIKEVIVYSEKFWMIYKLNTFGLAGFLDLRYKRSYIEVLFFTPSQARARNNLMIQINSPLLRELNFRKIFEQPCCDEEGFVNPLEVFQKIQDLAQNEIQAYLYLLDNEIKKINEDYENYPVNNNPYIRNIVIRLENMLIEFTIDFQNFPKRPILTFGKELKKIITEEEFNELETMKSWSEEAPLGISYIIDELMKKARSKKGEDWNSESQQIIMEDVLVSNKIPLISLKVHRGQTIGIVYGGSAQLKGDLVIINEIFRCICGLQKPIQGEIKIFGRSMIQTGEQLRNSMIIVSTSLDAKLESLSVMNCLKKGGRISLANTQFKRKKQFIKEIIEISMLKDKEDELILNLNTIERLKVSIGLALLRNPNIILFSVPKGSLGRLEMTSFNQYLKRISETFHTVLVIHGPKEIVSVCNKILTISDDKADSGTIEDLVLQIPQSGEVIEIELNNLNPDALNKRVFSSIFEDAIIIEERKNEKFKIFSQENPDDLIVKLMNIVGPFVYNFKRFKPSLSEYLEFKSIVS